MALPAICEPCGSRGRAGTQAHEWVTVRGESWTEWRIGHGGAQVSTCLTFMPTCFASAAFSFGRGLWIIVVRLKPVEQDVDLRAASRLLIGVGARRRPVFLTCGCAALLCVSQPPVTEAVVAELLPELLLLCHQSSALAASGRVGKRSHSLLPHAGRTKPRR